MSRPAALTATAPKRCRHQWVIHLLAPDGELTNEIDRVECERCHVIQEPARPRRAAPPPAAPAINESAFLRQVTDVATMLGWEWCHFRPARTDKGWRTPVSGSLGKGWPDLLLIREKDRRLIFAELKAGKGKLSADQERVLGVLGSLELPWSVQLSPRISVVTWRPADFDAIVEVLR